ncbi:hypothetical protein EJ07DRAFT_131606 [Lizonia empirigonia]|nr:hypothetical protein EJ07DRAFT_131606 [Lizonia empirigonia]
MTWRSFYGRGRPLRSAIAACFLAAFLFFGYDQGVFGGILQLQDYRDHFNHPNDTETGIIVSSYCLGTLFGCILNIFIGDYFGRRRMVR